MAPCGVWTQIGAKRNPTQILYAGGACGCLRWPASEAQVLLTYLVGAMRRGALAHLGRGTPTLLTRFKGAHQRSDRAWPCAKDALEASPAKRPRLTLRAAAAMRTRSSRHPGRRSCLAQRRAHKQQAQCQGCCVGHSSPWRRHASAPAYRRCALGGAHAPSLTAAVATLLPRQLRLCPFEQSRRQLS